MNDVLTGLLDLVQSVDPLLRTLLAGLAMVLETSVLLGLVVPGDTVAIVSATAVASPLEGVLLVAALVVGSLVGESVGFALGRRLVALAADGSGIVTSVGVRGRFVGFFGGRLFSGGFFDRSRFGGGRDVAHVVQAGGLGGLSDLLRDRAERDQLIDAQSGRGLADLGVAALRLFPELTHLSEDRDATAIGV